MASSPQAPVSDMKKHDRMYDKHPARQGTQSPVESGAPADFAGPVFPNPKGIKPTLDTDPVPPKPQKVYPGGATMNTQNASLDKPTGY